MAAEVKLGQHTLPVFPQPDPRVWRKLVPQAKEIIGTTEFGEQPTLATIVPVVEGRAYELLSLFIPALPEKMPEWEWHGYASREAMERGEDSDEAMDRAPNHAQIVAAAEAVFAVHRWNIYGALKAWIDPKVLAPQLNLMLIEALETGKMPGLESLKSLSASGASEPKPSTTDPTPGPSEDSPVLESPTS